MGCYMYRDQYLREEEKRREKETSSLEGYFCNHKDQTKISRLTCSGTKNAFTSASFVCIAVVWKKRTHEWWEWVFVVHILSVWTNVPTIIANGNTSAISTCQIVKQDWWLVDVEKYTWCMNKVYAYPRNSNYPRRCYLIIMMRMIVNEKRVQNALQVKDEKVDTSPSIQHTSFLHQW